MNDLPEFTKHLHSLLPDKYSLEHIGLGDFHLGDKVLQALQQPNPTDFQPTGMDRTLYLDLMEPIVREAVPWQDENGAIVDPVLHVEREHTSPRFVSPAAILMAFGRAVDLLPAASLTMDWTCKRMRDGSAIGADFWMRELVTAYHCLTPLVDSLTLKKWKDHLQAYVAEDVYKFSSDDPKEIEKFHNWVVYSSSGESMRENAGLMPDDPTIISGYRFFNKYMAAQRLHFTENGMYRDPNDPITYDITTRLQIVCALMFGYSGELEEDYQELLRRGGLMTLLFASPDGYTPYGGRSGQYHFQEAILSAICEAEARRYKETDTRLAGAFKRQARLSAMSVQRWLQMSPYRHIKNGYRPNESFGLDNYGVYSKYGLFIASVFGLAAIFADDEIPEYATPAQIGGFAFELSPAFHKVFAATRHTQMEIDLCADLNFESTGFGRFTVSGIPLELGPGMSITGTPHFQLPEENINGHLAIGPAWDTDSDSVKLADQSGSIDTTVDIQQETPDLVEFTVTYNLEDSSHVVRQSYRLQSGAVEIRSDVRQAGKEIAHRFEVPLLITDGMDESEIVSDTAGKVCVRYRNSTLTVTFDKGIEMEIDRTPKGNRNGVYCTLALSGVTSQKPIVLRLT